MAGSPGKATAVATSTTGLIAGAASRKVNAAASGRPWPINRRATGTEAHSQRVAPRRPAPPPAPRTRPASAAAGPARRVTRTRRSARTARRRAPGTAAPVHRRRRNTVAAIRTEVPSSAAASGRCSSSAATSTALNTCNEVTRRQPERRGLAAVLGLAAVVEVVAVSGWPRCWRGLRCWAGRGRSEPRRRHPARPRRPACRRRRWSCRWCRWGRPRRTACQRRPDQKPISATSADLSCLFATTRATRRGYFQRQVGRSGAGAACGRRLVVGGVAEGAGVLA